MSQDASLGICASVVLPQKRTAMQELECKWLIFDVIRKKIRKRMRDVTEKGGAKKSASLKKSLL